MTELRIAAVDPFDGDAFDAWYDVYLAAELVAGPAIGSPWMREELRVMLQERGTRSRSDAWTGSVDGEVVAAGFVRTPLLDNLTSAEIGVWVGPGHRRRGFGSAMLEGVEREASARGRTLLNAEALWSFESGPEGAGEPGPEFARRCGFELGLGDVKRLLELPVADELLDALAAEAAPHHAAYTLRSFVGPVPDELVDGWARLTSTLMTEAPTGELEREPEAIDASVVRESEAVAARQGRTKFNTVALDEHGDVVAYTDIATTVHEPGKAYQWGTLVRRDARGHRLGVAVKVANLRLLQREASDIRRLTTYNAEVNRHMVQVNERMGFVPVARLGEFQKRLT